MPTVDRFTVSLDTELLAAFDRFIAERRYENRSEAVRDMIRDLLVADRLDAGGESVTAFLTFVSDHRVRDTFQRVRTFLGSSHELVQSWTQTRVDEHRDHVAVGLRGCWQEVRAAADQIQALRGVSFGRLSAVPIRGAAE